MRMLQRLLVALALMLVAPTALAKTPDGYTYYSIGDPAAATPGKTGFGMMLMGGGGWSHDAWHWFIA
jgi:hypothetical protein